MPQIGVCFDEYPYVVKHDRGLEVTSYPVFVNDLWWIDGNPTTIEVIGEIYKIPEDELIFLKLKYGG